MTGELTVYGGKVWIGDPCYVVQGDDWMAACEEFAKQDKLGLSKSGVYEVHTENWNFLAASTQHGDGCYIGDKTSQKYLVDAGLLGIVILRDDMTFEDKQKAEQHGMIFDVKAGSIMLRRYKDGMFYFLSNGNCIESIKTDIEFSDKSIIDDILGD